MLQGRGDPEIDEHLQRVLAAGDYTLVGRDTTIARDDVVAGTLLVVDATLYLEGEVRGDLIGVDANLFLRPSARVRGVSLNAGGGLYRSELAVLGGPTLDRPRAPYRVVLDGDRITIVGTAGGVRVELDGFAGLHPPTYDRVDAATIRWGASLVPPPARRFRTRLHAVASFRTGRGEPGGLVELSVRGDTLDELTAGVTRDTETNEGWIRGDLANTLSFLGVGNDYRDYYEVDRFWVQLTRGWRHGALHVVGGVRAHLERARSLGAGDPWTILGDRPRANPPVDDGRISALVAALDGSRATERTTLAAGAAAEIAGAVAGGDFSFAYLRAGANGSWTTARNHTLRLRIRLQQPLPGPDLPRQRWGSLGGLGTLPTFEIGEFRGDRVFFVEGRYELPVPLRLPAGIGEPRVHAVYAAGFARADRPAFDPVGEDVPALPRSSGRLEHNAALELHTWSPFIGVAVDPRDLDDLVFYVGLGIPIPRRPAWQ